MQKLFVKLLSGSAATAIAIRYYYVDNYAVSLDSENEKLISVHMFTRHGARTPLNLIKGLDEAEYRPDLLEPYVHAKYELATLENEKLDDIISFYDQKGSENKLRGGAARGLISKVGEKQLFDLGRKIREKYIKDLQFLSSDYNAKEIYSRSSHYKRTINSAKSLLSGMYCDSHLEVPSSPFVINVHKLDDDYIFPNALSCPYFAEMEKFIEKLELYSKHNDYLQNLKSLSQILQNYSIENKNLSFTMFRDDLSARKIHGLPVPKELEEMLEKADRYASIELTASLKHNIKISCGRLLKMIKENMVQTYKDDLNNKNVGLHKFRYYSAHDSTLNAILCAFDLIDDSNESWPPFAAHIEIELWKNLDIKEENENSYFIRMYYCDKLVNLPSCKNNKCKLSDFIQILNKNAVDDHGYNNLCNRSFTGSVSQ